MTAKKAKTAKTRRAPAKVVQKHVPHAEAKAEVKGDVKQRISQAIEQMRETSRERMLAGLGAIARIGKQREERLAELVEEGKRVEPKVKKAFKELIEKLQPKTDMKFDLSKLKIDRSKFDRAAIQQRLQTGVTNSYHRLGLPTRKEVQALARKVDKLAEAQSA